MYNYYTDNTGKDIRSPVKSTAHVKPVTSFREEVRIQHGTDVLTFETDAEGNVPVAKIDAVLSHVVALKYRLPQNKQSYSDLSNDGFGSRSSTPRPHSREGNHSRIYLTDKLYQLSNAFYRNFAFDHYL